MPYQLTPVQQSVGYRLGQSRPSNTNNASIFSPSDEETARITKIIVANVSGASAKYRIFHDATGASYTQNTALFYDVPLPGGTTDILPLDIDLKDDIENVAIRSDTANALTFTVYGETTQKRTR